MNSCVKPTIIERVVNLIPGSFGAKSLILSSLLGVPMLLLTRFLDTLNLEMTLAIFGPLVWQNIVTFCIANFALIFYAIYGVRYMRSKIVAIMPEIKFLLPENADGLHRIFKPICRLTPAIVFSLLLMAASLASFPDQISQHSAGVLSFAQIVISFPLLYLAYGTFIWVYSSSILSLHNLGRCQISLRSFCEDSHLGVKPVGSLSLSLAIVYFSGLVLVFFSFVTIPLPLAFAVGVMIVGGMILFYLPLRSFHEQMKRTKKRELDRTKTLLDPLTGVIEESLQSTRKIEARDLRRALIADIMDRQTSLIPEWPFETRTLTWLSAIVLAVVVSIVTKYVTFLFG